MKYPDKFKNDVVGMVTGGVSVGQVSKTQGVARTTVYRWVNEKSLPVSVDKRVDVIRKAVTRQVIPQAPTDKVKGFELSRGYDAGSTGNFTANWFAPSTDINEIVKSNITLIRSRSADRLRNDDYAKGYLNMMVSNIVGPTGIRLQSIASLPDGTRDVEAITAIETAWNNWAKYAEFSDITGQDNWRAILIQLVNSFTANGEIFLRHIEGKEAGKYGYSVEVWNPADCDENLALTLDNGNIVYMGVELSKWNKPVAYYFISNSDSAINYGSSHHSHRRIPAKEMIHAFKKEFVGQIRGIPTLGTVLSELKMLSDFEDAALINAQIGARSAGFYTSTGVEDNTTGANAIDDDGELLNEMQAGQFTKLPPGYDFKMFDSRYPDGELATFKMSLLQGIASALGVDYPSLGQDWSNVNLSSARVAINETREGWKIQQQFFIDKIVTPVFERWLAQALVRNKVVIKIKKQNKPVKLLNLSINEIEKYKEVQWLPRKWGMTDPVKETKSNIELMNNGIFSHSTLATSLGYDYEVEIEKNARDIQFAKDNGFNLIENDSGIDEEIEKQEVEELEESKKELEKV